MILYITERLIIREYEQSDANSMARVFNNEEIYRTTYGIPKNYTKSYAKWWIKYLHSNAENKTGYEFGMFLKDSGVYIGNLGVINIISAHNRGDITYLIEPSLWGRGFATEGGEAMKRLAFEALRLNRLGGCCMSCNKASRRVMEKLGFKYEGTIRNELYKDGIYYDIDRLGMLSEDYFLN